MIKKYRKLLFKKKQKKNLLQVITPVIFSVRMVGHQGEITMVITTVHVQQVLKAEVVKFVSKS